MRKYIGSFVLSITLLLSANSPGKDGYHFNIPAELVLAPGIQTWGVRVFTSHSGYRVMSVSRLNGAQPLREEPGVIIASGSSGTWSWEIRGTQSLLPSWNAWQHDKRIEQRIQGSDNWDHAVASWEQGFTRAQKVAAYLLGHEPLPLRVTLLLLPEDSRYHQTFTQADANSIPLTLAFYYPATSNGSTDDMSIRLAALAEAVGTSMHEYQHILNQLQAIQPAGRGKTDKSINSEIRSHCWKKVMLMALTAGSHSVFTWGTSQSRQKLLESMPPKDAKKWEAALGADELRPKLKRHFSNANFWGEYLEERITAAYLRERGISDLRVVSNDPVAMDAALSVCRAITQDSIDLTSVPYPPSQVRYTPFFSSPGKEEK